MVKPRKANWDLKRDIQKKLSHLSKETDTAIMQMIRMKLSKNNTADAAATEGPSDTSTAAAMLLSVAHSSPSTANEFSTTGLMFSSSAEKENEFTNDLTMEDSD